MSREDLKTFKRGTSELSNTLLTAISTTTLHGEKVSMRVVSGICLWLLTGSVAFPEQGTLQSAVEAGPDPEARELPQ